MWKDRKRFTLPGSNPGFYRRLFGWMIWVVVFPFLLYGQRLWRMHTEIKKSEDFEAEVLPIVMGNPFGRMMEHRMVGLTLFVVVYVFVVIYNYYYFYIRTNSHYLMRRLPNRMEIHKRCLVEPLISIVEGVVVAVVLVLLSRLAYDNIMPSIENAYDSWNIWRMLL